MTTERFRKRYKFWLNILKDDEFELAEELDTLKKRRLFTPTIRDGIRLILDLRKGNMEILFELFPHLQEKFSGDSEQKTTQSKSQNNDQSSNLQKQIDRLETLLKEQGAVPINSVHEVITGQHSPQSISVSSKPTKDSGIKITQTKSNEKSNSSKNFANMMFGLNNS